MRLYISTSPQHKCEMLKSLTRWTRPRFFKVWCGVMCVVWHRIWQATFGVSILKAKELSESSERD